MPGHVTGYVVFQSIRCVRTYQRGTRPSGKGAEYTFDLCHVLPGTVTGECSPRRLPSTRTVPVLGTVTIMGMNTYVWVHVQLPSAEAAAVEAKSEAADEDVPSSTARTLDFVSHPTEEVETPLTLPQIGVFTMGSIAMFEKFPGLFLELRHSFFALSTSLKRFWNRIYQVYIITRLGL